MSYKKGGYLYINFYGKGGIIQEIIEVLKKKYNQDKKFKKIINNLDKKTFQKIITFIKKEYIRDKSKE